MNKPLPQSPLLKNRYCFLVFSRKMFYKHKYWRWFDSCDNFDTYTEDLAFNQWLAGLIDGDGTFSLPKSGKYRFDITMDARDKKSFRFNTI